MPLYSSSFVIFIRFAFSAPPTHEDCDHLASSQEDLGREKLYIIIVGLNAPDGQTYTLECTVIISEEGLAWPTC